MNSNQITISKTDFMAYIDAPRHLWAIKNTKLVAKQLNSFISHLFEQGYQVEEYANKYIQEVLLPTYKVDSNDKEKFILQASAVENQFEARVDALIYNSEKSKWDIYEVKSSTDVTKEHFYDATFQYLVFKKSYEIGSINIITLNKEYVRNGEIELKELFKVINIDEQVKKYKERVHEARHEALEVVTAIDPTTIQECIRPKLCPCKDICHPVLPKYSIYDVNRLTGNEKKIRQLVEMGILNALEIPDDFELSDLQRQQLNIAKSGIPEIKTTEIKESINQLVYPLYFIDYESFNPAIPMYDGYKPYDQMPFQWSLHILKEPNGKLEHYEFLETNPIDPIPSFLNEMKKVIGDSGSIIVWNERFEGRINTRMGEIRPEFAEFTNSLNERLYDLMKIFEDQLYAHPDFMGSYSIKKVLPTLVPGMTYDGMNIGDGATAMTSWFDAVHGTLSAKQKDKTFKDLLVYCGQDTMAMVKIWEVLKEL